MKIEDKIRKISYSYYHHLLSLKNVIGVGLGHKWINGVNTYEPCLHVLVKNKVSKQYLCCQHLIPKTYMGIKTDVIDLEFSTTNEIPSNKELDKKIRPLQGGYSMSAFNKDFVFGSGTITCIVTKKGLITNDFFILGNYHVMVKNKEKLNIMQPSISGGGKVTDKVGQVSDFVPIKHDTAIASHSNLVDCAIAKINKSLASNMMGLVGKINGVGEASLGIKVKKVGKTTGLTEGIVTSIGATIKATVDGSKATFKDQIIASTSSAPGDSGSALLNEKNEIIGLLMGENTQGKSSFNDIKTVLKFLKVQIF